MLNRIYRTGLLLLYYINNKYLWRFVRFVMVRRSLNLLIHIGNECNYNCRYCYVDKNQTTLRDEMWFSIVEDAKRIGVKKVGILGGEPFCKPELLKGLLDKLRQLRLTPYIYTNGSLVTEQWLRKLVKYKPVIVYKYDSDNDNYQSITSQNKYTLRDIEEKIKLTRNYGLRVVTFTVLVKQNIDKITEIFERSLNLGAFPAFERYLPVRDSYTNKLFDISDEDFYQGMQKLLPYFKNFKKEWISAVKIMGRSCGCYANILSISPSGEVFVCPYLPDKASLGNIKDKSLKEFYALMREKTKTEYTLPAKCKRCKYIDECGGGCFTYSFLKTGKYLPHCNRSTSVGFCAYFLVDVYGDSLV